MDPPPTPPAPPKIEVTFDQLEHMQWKEVKEDMRDDFVPNMVYNVGAEESDDDSVFVFFNPKGKDKSGATGMTNKSNRTTKKSILSKNSKGSKNKA